jgi:hypothetical protein
MFDKKMTPDFAISEIAFSRLKVNVALPRLKVKDECEY